MEELKITRYELFLLAIDKSLNYDLNAISEMYKLSAITIEGMEHKLIENQNQTVDFFRKDLEHNLDSIHNYYYTKEIRDSFNEKIEKKKNKSYVDCFYYLLEVITEYQEKTMKDFSEDYSFIARQEEQKNHYISRVFLSYAYDDRGITLALFFYFLNKDIFLYVDWMHNGMINDCSLLKYYLRRNLENSDQLLLLKTINSELSIRGGKKTIRQWCAWELGCFYSDIYDKKKDEKYYIDFYGNDFVKTTTPTNNLFLDTIKKMTDISNGRIR